MYRTFLVVALLALSTPAFAQRVAFSIDLRTVGAVDASPVDDDGYPDTKAWLLTLAADPLIAEQRFQLVVAQGAGFCFEAPFPIAGTTGDSAVNIITEGRRTMLKVTPRGVELIVNPTTGRWDISVPIYAPVELQRLRCR